MDMATPSRFWPPLVIAALIALAIRSLRRQNNDVSTPVLWALLAVIPSLLFSPASLLWARINLHAVVVVLMLSAWVTGGAKSRLLTEGALGALIVGAMLTLFWVKPKWDVPLETFQRLVDIPPEHRERVRLMGTMLPTKTGTALDEELERDAVVAYDGAYRFPANLWNSDFSNRLVYLGEDPRGDHEAQLDGIDAKWVAVRKGDPWHERLLTAPVKWCEVGRLDKGNLAYRRCDSPGTDE